MLQSQMALEPVFSACRKLAQGTLVGPAVMNRTFVPVQGKLVGIDLVQAKFALELYFRCLMKTFMPPILKLQSSPKLAAGKSTGKGKLLLENLLMGQHVILEWPGVIGFKAAVGEVVLELPIHRMGCHFMERNLMLLLRTVVTKLAIIPSLRNLPIFIMFSFPMSFQAGRGFGRVFTPAASM